MFKAHSPEAHSPETDSTEARPSENRSSEAGAETPRPESPWYADGLYHVVLATPELEPTLTPGIRHALHPYLRGCVGDLGGKLVAAGGRPDHVHLLVDAPGGWDCLRVMDRLIRRVGPCRHQTLPLVHLDGDHGIFPIPRCHRRDVLRLIRRQARIHRRMTFEEEVAREMAATARWAAAVEELFEHRSPEAQAIPDGGLLVHLTFDLGRRG